MIDAGDLMRTVCRAVQEDCDQEDDEDSDSADEQLYQLELLRVKLAEVTIETRAAGAQYQHLRAQLYRVLR